LGAKIRESFPGAKVELIKGSRGAFNVTVDGREVWNKHEMGDEYPDEERLVAGLKGSS
jgi:selT/selW/selH-like putative selenoprotein